jgi:hypothetical protein
MEYPSDFYYGEQEQEEETEEKILTAFNIASLVDITENTKKLRDDRGNTLLHRLARCATVKVDFLRTLIVDKRWSVCEKNLNNEDPWIYGLRFHASNPIFFELFDLLYHGPTKLQWDALSGATMGVYDSLEKSPDCLLETDQRGFPLVYYAWRNSTLLKELVARGAFSESRPEMYKKVVLLWLFRAQQEAKCGHAKKHRKIVEALRIAFSASDALLSWYGKEFFGRTIYVDSGLVDILLRKLAVSTKNTEEFIQKTVERVKKRYDFSADTYYSAVLSLIYKYLADA